MADNSKSNSIAIARKFLDALVLEGRILGAEHPTSRIEILGKAFETPIATGALSHLKPGMAGFAEGAKMAGALCTIGMGDNEQLGEVLAAGDAVIKVIKPYADENEILSRIRFAEENGAFGVGMDVEHAVNSDDDEDSMVGPIPMKLPTKEELKKYVESTKLPFFFKGALSVQDALLAKEIGAVGIILSHHNSLMKWAIPPYALLPEIRKAVGEDFLLIADGGIEDGFDAFKVLTLGADLVCIGRSLIKPYNEKGAEGVCEVITKMTKELKAAMVRTGTKDLQHKDPAVLHKAWWLSGYGA